jgi:hypothetical protein
VTIQESLRREAQRKYLARDEQIDAVMWGVALRPLAIYALGWLLAGGSTYRAIICTDRRTLLCQGGLLGATLEGILATCDRQPLGPPRGFYHRIDIFGSPVSVGRRFYKDIRAADALLAQRTHGGPD